MEVKERTYNMSGSSARRSFAFFDDTDAHIDFIRLVHDGNGESEASHIMAKNGLVLEGYFNDLYKLFVRKLSQFECETKISNVEQAKLKTLLDELIRVKRMLCTSDEADD